MHATATILTDAHSSLLSASSVCEAPAFAEERHSAHESNVVDGSCVKGLIVALSLEAAAVLLFCAVWQTWHFMR